MGWFSKLLHFDRKAPDGLWIKCKSCGELIFRKELIKSLKVCGECGYHFRMTAAERRDALLDENSFIECDAMITSGDPLEFVDTEKYTERIKKAVKETGMRSAVMTGEGTIFRRKVAVAILDFHFMGGSMSSDVGEKITRIIERAAGSGLPFIAVTASGGARMQEGIFSLMQMAKTAQAVARLRRAGLPMISVLTDPTTGGVTASFAMLGDILIAEPKALIGFAGPRVIEQTIRQKLPEGFQKAEFLLEHGIIDMVVDRRNMKETIYNLLSFTSGTLPLNSAGVA